jgi:hypothetical protein
VLVGEGAFGADDALGDGGFGGEEGARDLVSGEAAEETESEGCAGLGGEDGMAGDEDKAEEVVADGVVESGVEVWRGLFEGLEFAGQLFVFALGDGIAAAAICWRSDLAAQPVSLLCAGSALRTGWVRSLPSQRSGGFRLRSRRRGCSWGHA